MNKLIKMTTIVAGVAAMLNVAGCGGDSSKDATPEGVAMLFFETIEAGKADEGFLRKVCVDDVVKEVSEHTNKAREGLKGVTLEVASKVVLNDAATIKVRCVGGKMDGVSVTFDMRQVDGRWKIEKLHED